MFMVSWYKEINIDHFSKKLIRNKNNKVVYSRITISRLTVVWMENKKAREMLIKETCPSFAIKKN